MRILLRRKESCHTRLKKTIDETNNHAPAEAKQSPANRPTRDESNEAAAASKAAAAPEASQTEALARSLTRLPEYRLFWVACYRYYDSLCELLLLLKEQKDQKLKG